MDFAEDVAERCCFVAGQGPKSTSSCDVAANAGDKGRDEDDNQKTQGATSSTGSLHVKSSKRESRDAREGGVKILNGIKECRQV